MEIAKEISQSYNETIVDDNLGAIYYQNPWGNMLDITSYLLSLSG